MVHYDIMEQLCEGDILVYTSKFQYEDTKKQMGEIT